MLSACCTSYLDRALSYLDRALRVGGISVAAQDAGRRELRVGRRERVNRVANGLAAQHQAGRRLHCLRTPHEK